MPDAPADEPSTRSAPAAPSPTAGGRSAWIVIGVVGLALVLVVALTSFWGADTTSSANPDDGADRRLVDHRRRRSPPGSTGSCAAPVSEPLDPTAAIRLLPNAPEPTYATDPPSSGAFVVGASVGPTPADPLSRPVQVGLLAQGKVLIQYSSALPPADVADLQGLAGDDIVVAPNPTMASPIVATAWRTRQVCDQLELSTLRQFATVNAEPGTRRERQHHDDRLLNHPTNHVDEPGPTNQLDEPTNLAGAARRANYHDRAVAAVLEPAYRAGSNPAAPRGLWVRIPPAALTIWAPGGRGWPDSAADPPRPCDR